MISIALRNRNGQTLDADNHERFVDLPGHETDERCSWTEVDVHEDVCVVPLVARLNSMPAIDSIPDIERALAKVQKERPDRTDGVALATLLSSWARRYPDAWWDVSGPALRVMAEKGKHGVDFSGESNDRFSARNVGTDDLGAMEMGTGTIEALALEADHDPDKCGNPRCTRCNSIDDRTLRGDHVVSGGGGSKSRVRKDRPLTGGEIAQKQQRALQEDGLTRPAFIGARVSDEAKRVLVDERLGPSAGEILEQVANAIISGRTWEDVQRSLKRSA